MGLGDAGGNSARLPMYEEQGAGSWLALAAFSLYLARGSFATAWKNAVRPPRERDPAAPMSDRMAIFGLIGGFLFLVGFGIASGMKPLVALILMTPEFMSR